MTITSLRDALKTLAQSLQLSTVFPSTVLVLLNVLVIFPEWWPDTDWLLTNELVTNSPSVQSIESGPGQGAHAVIHRRRRDGIPALHDRSGVARGDSVLCVGPDDLPGLPAQLLGPAVEPESQCVH